MEMTPIALFLLFAALVIAVGIYGHRASKRRRAAFQAWATAGGWQYHSKRQSVDLPFRATKRGENRYLLDRFTRALEDAVPGLDAARFELFDYHYEVESGSGDNQSTTHYHLTCALVDAQLEFGDVRIETESLFDRLVQSFGFEDIDFDHGEFSKRFKVSAKHPKQAHELLGHELMDYLLAHDEWRIETQGRVLFACRTGKPDLLDFEAADRFARGFLQHLPRLLVNLERERRGLPPSIQAGAVGRSSEHR